MTSYYIEFALKYIFNGKVTMASALTDLKSAHSSNFFIISKTYMQAKVIQVFHPCCKESAPKKTHTGLIRINKACKPQ